MPIPSPFHERTAALCESLFWKDWSGYFAVRSYDTTHEREYYAYRHSAGLMDVTPLFKYEVCGDDAAEFLAGVMVRDIRKLKKGRVTYCCWCDDDGKVVDDGTVHNLGDGHYRVTAADPTLRWLQECARGFDVTIEDSTDAIGALALQGPTSGAILADCSDADMKALKFFRVTDATIDGVDVQISRTGYTGDLGYEVWIPREHALHVWDAIYEAGRPHGIEPAGLDALDVTRVEAGFVMAGVDYFSARHAVIESRKSTPDEIDLGWCVTMNDREFVGKEAIENERQRGSARAFVGLEIDWEELVRLYDAVDLPPALPLAAWRTPTPVYSPDGVQVGRASSGAWSPLLKKNLALATIVAPWAEIGTELRIEQTVEYVRHEVTARVSKKPFFDPPRKKA